ncbi:MAG: hypothetical protein RIR48_822 [Bacteroidota bacterium]|jgi:hypothetical protein
MRIFLFIYFATASILLGQDTDYNNRLHMISDRSYIQLMRGNIPSRNQNTSETTKTTFMEAQIAPFYFIRFGENSKVALAVSPKIIIRMADAESLPIKTPSFMPTITAFHKVNLTSLSKNKITNWLITPNHHTYLIYRFAHHSNGQKDEFFVSGTRRINFATGNFSTDYAEVGFQWNDMSIERNRFTSSGRLSMEHHFSFGREADLREIYYFNRFILENEFSIYPWMQLGTRFDLMTGSGSRFETTSSYQFSLELQPFRKWSDLSVFVRIYSGPDYYNIRYFSEQQFIGGGIRANPKSSSAIGF